VSPQGSAVSEGIVIVGIAAGMLGSSSNIGTQSMQTDFAVGRRERLLSSVIVRALIPAAVAASVCLGFHLWWYGQVVSEIERACVPAAKFAGLPPTKPETIGEAMYPLIAGLRAMGEFASGEQ
jgi:hypothetical protein